MKDMLVLIIIAFLTYKAIGNYLAKKALEYYIDCKGYEKITSDAVDKYVKEKILHKPS